MSNVERHYDKDYFEWQRKSGQTTGRVQARVFQPYIRFDDVVLDFGCGGGFLLAALRCGHRVGVEINASARANAAALAIDAQARLSEIPDSSIDVLISHHAIEHVMDPASVLTELYRCGRPGARLLLVVPCDRPGDRFDATDINKHLFSWSPMNLGNIVSAAGFEVTESFSYRHAHPPRIADWLAEHGGPKQRLFHAVATAYGHSWRAPRQTVCAAVRP
jgi:SAM-dependent methyltransferase